MFVIFTSARNESTIISSWGGSENNSASTVGELAIITFSTGDLIVTQGFQQSRLAENSDDDGNEDGNEDTNINELREVGININILPNPTKNSLNVSLDGLNKGEIILKLLDLFFCIKFLKT